MTREELAYIIHVQDRELQQLQRQIDVLNKQLAASGMAAKKGSEDTSKAFRRTGDDSDTLGVQLRGLQGHLFQTNQGFTTMRNITGLLKFPALIAGIGLAAQVLNAAAGGAIALTSALAPLSGAVVAYPAMMAAFAQGMGVAKLATSGLSEALSGNEKALERIGPAGREFVAELKTMKPRLDELRSTAQRNMFPGLLEGLRAAMQNFGALKPIVAATASELGSLATQAGQLVGSRAFGRDLATIGRTNVGIIHELGQGALALVDALRNLLVAAGPFTTWLAQSVRAGAEWVNQQVTAGRETGRLQAFLEKTKTTMQTLGSILMHLARGFFEIGKASAPLGRQMLADLDKLTAKFEAWTKSVEGKRSMAQYFRDAKPVLYEMVRLLGAVGGAFLRLGKSDSASPLLRTLRTEILPVLEDVISTTTKNLGPPLLELIKNIARIFGTIGGSSGPLVMFVKTLAFLAGVLADVIAFVPGLNSMTSSMVGLFGVSKALGMTFGSLNNSLTRWIGQMILTKTTQFAVAAGTKAWAAAQWLLNAAMSANPVVLIIGLLVALGAALVLLWTKSETFREIVIGTWNAIRDAATAVFEAVRDAIVGAWNFIHDTTVTVWNTVRNFLRDWWPVLLGIMTGGIGLVVALIVKNWGAIKQKTIDVFNAIVEFFVALPGRIWSGITGGLTWLWGQFAGAWDTFKGGVETAVGKVVGFFTNLPGKIKDAFVNAWDGVVGLIHGPFNTLITWIGNKVDAGVKFFKDMPGKIASALEAGWEWAKKKLKEAITKVFSFLPEFVRNALDIGSPSKVFEKIGRDIILGAVKGIEDNASRLLDAAWDKFASVADVAGNIWDTVTGHGGGPTPSPVGLGIPVQPGVDAVHLLPRVIAAVRFAMQHGWTGMVTSGYRSYQEQKYLWDNAAALGLTRGVDVARPGTSSHEHGEAVDVTNWQQFLAAMRMMPANLRLNWLGMQDRVHFSISGHARGGVILGETLGLLGEGGRKEVVLPLETRAGRRYLSDALAEALRTVGGRDTPAMHVENQYVNDPTDAILIAEQMKRLAVR